VEITATMVKDLRAATGAGVLDCRKALETSGGNSEQAAALLREKGLAAAAKKATREANEGLIGSYIHMGSKVAALVEVDCESDFVARTADFQALAKDLAMQIVAARPGWVRSEDIPAEVIQRETENYKAEAAAANKPAAMVDRIVEGKLAKFYEENVLLEQPFIKDESVKVRDLISQSIAKLGENIVVRRFTRLEVGG
jgi:elongation factor Ts